MGKEADYKEDALFTLDEEPQFIPEALPADGSEKKWNLHKKLNWIRSKIKPLYLDKRAFSYEYVTGYQVLNSIFSNMNRIGVILVPEIETSEFQEFAYKNAKGQDKLAFLTHGKMFYTWINTDNPKDILKVPWRHYGQQEDLSQAFGSGLTYAERMFVKKFFNIPEGAIKEDDGRVVPIGTSIDPERNDYRENSYTRNKKPAEGRKYPTEYETCTPDGVIMLNSKGFDKLCNEDDPKAIAEALEKYSTAEYQMSIPHRKDLTAVLELHNKKAGKNNNSSGKIF